MKAASPFVINFGFRVIQVGQRLYIFKERVIPESQTKAESQYLTVKFGVKKYEVALVKELLEDRGQLSGGNVLPILMPDRNVETFQSIG